MLARQTFYQLSPAHGKLLFMCFLATHTFSLNIVKKVFLGRVVKIANKRLGYDLPK
jgi:hypothetical protein